MLDLTRSAQMVSSPSILTPAQNARQRGCHPTSGVPLPHVRRRIE